MTSQAWQWGLKNQTRELDGTGVAAATTLSTQFGLIISGSTSGSPLVSTGALTAGDATCTFPTATLTVGDVLMIQSSTQLYMDGVSGATEKRGEMVEVWSITDSAHFEATEPLKFSYTSGATTTAQKLNLLDNPVVDMLELTMGGTGKGHNGVLFDLCRNPVIRNATIDGCEDTGVQFTRCWGGTVEYSTVLNATSPSFGTTGYGVAVLDGSRDITIGPGNTFKNCRHGVSGGGSPPALDVHVFGNTSENCAVGFDCHEPCFGWTFDSNTDKGSRGAGIQMRGQRSKAINNTVLYPASHGVFIKSFDTNTDGLQDCEATGNIVIGSGGAGVRVEGTTTCRVAGVKIEGNTLRNNTLNNLTVLLADRVQIGPNTYDTPVGSGNDGNNVRIVGSSASDRCEQVTVTGGHFKNTPMRWLKADFALDLTVVSPYIVNNVNNTLITSCTNARVINPTGPAAALLSSVSNTDTNFTQTPLVSAETIYHTGTLTADRAISLSLTQNMYTGARFCIVRTGGGAFNLNILNGVAGATLKALVTNTRGEFVFDGTNWKLASYGAL